MEHRLGLPLVVDEEVHPEVDQVVRALGGVLVLHPVLLLGWDPPARGERLRADDNDVIDEPPCQDVRWSVVIDPFALHRIRIEICELRGAFEPHRDAALLPSHPLTVDDEEV
jgi:hypothetical protein